MRKIIFMDVDGVLNSMKTVYAQGRYPRSLRDVLEFDGCAMQLIRRFCEESGAKIVLSSSWRNWNTVQDCRESMSLPIIDKTPHIKGVDRGSEIEAWLQANTDVEEYAILDDGNNMLLEQMPYFIRTNTMEGFGFHDYCRLCELFGINPFLQDVGEIPGHFSYIDRELWRGK